MSKQGPDVAGVKFKPVSESYWKINLAMLLASQILIMCGFSAMNPFIGLFIKEKLAGGSDAVLATGIALYSFFGDMGYALFNPVWGKLSDRFGVKPMLLRGTFLSCLLHTCTTYCVDNLGSILNSYVFYACCKAIVEAERETVTTLYTLGNKRCRQVSLVAITYKVTIGKSCRI